MFAMKLADAAKLSLPGRIAAAAVLGLFGIGSIVWAYSSSRGASPALHVEEHVGQRDQLTQDSPSDRAPAPVAEPTKNVLRLDLNTATQAELELLPGVGPALSKRIVEYREKNGRFERLEDLDKVAGIGPKMLEKIRPFAQVGPPPAH